MATRRASGEQCAIKLLHLKDALVTPRGDPAIELLSEIEILKALQGTPGVVSLLDHLRQIEPPIMAAVFELLMGGDLFDRIETHGPCTEPEAALIAQQVGGALAHMHSLLAFFQQHRRAEWFAIRTLGLQSMQPERHRDGEQAGEEQGRKEAHRYCRLCRNSR